MRKKGESVPSTTPKRGEEGEGERQKKTYLSLTQKRNKKKEVNGSIQRRRRCFFVFTPHIGPPSLSFLNDDYEKKYFDLMILFTSNDPLSGKGGRRSTRFTNLLITSASVPITDFFFLNRFFGFSSSSSSSASASRSTSSPSELTKVTEGSDVSASRLLGSTSTPVSRISSPSSSDNRLLAFSPLATSVSGILLSASLNLDPFKDRIGIWKSA